MTTIAKYRHAVAKVLAGVIVVTGSCFIYVEPSHTAQAQSIEVCGTRCAYQSIQSAIDAAVAGTTVTVEAGTYNESITLKAGVSLAGAGVNATILRGDGSRPVITAQGGGIHRETVVEALAVTGGGGIRGGGVLVQSGAAPTLRHVAIYGNAVQRAGGGVAVIDGGDLLLEDALVHDNTALGGAGIGVSNGRAIVRTSRFENNTASSAGGGVSVDQRSTVTLDSVVFIGNQANLGGAISISDASISIVASQFEQNLAHSSGGAIRAVAGTSLLVNGSRFVSNVAETIHGGALYLTEAQGEIRNTTFDDNRAAAIGGAVYWNAAPDAIFAGNTVVNNRAMDGGGIQFIGGHARVSQNVVRENTASRFGGGIVMNLGVDLAAAEQSDRAQQRR